MSKPRRTEPWLTGFDAWRPCSTSLAKGAAVAASNCGEENLPADLVSVAIDECDVLMKGHADIVRVLAYVPQCTDAAVDRLADLAAAYYIRAQRNDDPGDFVRSLDAAERALRVAPTLTAARFNRALALEVLDFPADALQSWDQLRKTTDAQWAAEAARHYARLSAETLRSAAVQWPLNRDRLVIAAHAHDQRAVTQLVSPYRAAAQRYVEETLLPGWAGALAARHSAEAEEQLALAEMIANALADLTHDPYLHDAVQLIRSNGSNNKALGAAHILFLEARNASRSLGKDPLEITRYVRAERALGAVGSPLRLGVQFMHATALAQKSSVEAAFAMLRSLEREAVRYPGILARVHTGRGYAHNIEGRYFDVLAEYDRALRLFEQTGDAEKISEMHVRKLGIFRVIGHREFAWREVFRTRAASVFDMQSRHLRLGEIAETTVELGYPAIAVRYQDQAVRLLEDQLAGATDPNVIENLRGNLGIARRARAAIRVLLRDRTGAKADLDAAVPLIGTPDDAGRAAISIGFAARLSEVRAQTLPASDIPGRISVLTDAIRFASSTHYHTLIASLLLQRAEVYQRGGNRSAALQDLRAAVQALRAQERSVLESRGDMSDEERLWSPYFSRTQEAYRQLIAFLVDQGSDDEAFAWAEKARAFEPLNLLLRRGDVPPDFLRRIHDGEPLDLAGVRDAIPVGTALLQYCVLDERTYVWIVWHDGAERLTLSAGDTDIAKWTKALQRAARLRDRDGFDAALNAPSIRLLRGPLEVIRKRLGSAIQRIVVVPDRSLHGLPFAALRDGNRHLINDYTVSIAASATLYAYSLAQDAWRSRMPPGSALLIADPAFDRTMDIADDLRDLAAARAEVAAIRNVYAPVLDVMKPLEGADATPAAFFRLARQSSIIHVAAHGIANAAVPSRSFLLMAPGENDSGVVDAERLVHELQLKNARLVVLSACSSAGGVRIGPEGLAPLVRPLLVAGVPGVVGTLWDVNDNAATSQLLVRFHSHYRDGHDAAEALRLAQLDMAGQRDIQLASAISWAPFQMIGCASSPFATHATPPER